MLDDSCLCRWWPAWKLLFCSSIVGLSAPPRLCLQGNVHLSERWTHFSLSLLTPCMLVHTRRHLPEQTLKRSAKPLVGQWADARYLVAGSGPARFAKCYLVARSWREFDQQLLVALSRRKTCQQLLGGRELARLLPSALCAHQMANARPSDRDTLARCRWLSET